MLTDHELEELFIKCDIPESGRERIRRIRKEMAVRVADGGTYSVRTRYCSRKMGFAIDTEAWHTEFPSVVTWDNDEETLEFYPQPAKLKINWTDKIGKRRSYLATPDFLRITHDSFEFIECKLEVDLKDLAEKSSERFSVDQTGRWRFIPAEEAARELGCKYTIRSSSENNWVLVENLEFLRDYLYKDIEIAESDLEALKKLLIHRPWITLDELLNGEHSINADTAYSAVVKGLVYFNIIKDRLTETHTSHIFRDQENANAYSLFVASKKESTFNEVVLSLSPGSRFEWDGKQWEILNIGDRSIAARSSMEREETDCPIIEFSHEEISTLAKLGRIVPLSIRNDAAEDGRKLMESFSREQLQIATWRFEVIRGRPSLNNPLINRSVRSVQYWKSEWQKAEIRYGYGFIGLAPNRDKKQGNKNRKIDSAILDIIDAVLEEGWPNPTQKSLTNLYGKVVSKCTALGMDAPCRKTFLSEKKRKIDIRKHTNRFGRRMAYEHEAIQHWWIDYSTPTHGTHPFHIAHIDSTPLDIKVKDKSAQKLMKSLWLTFLVDAYSRKVLAFYLSFDRPSYRSSMMVIRECVRRHGRLPNIIVSDKGSEHTSVYYETLLAKFETHKRDRPCSKPRTGSIIERLFKTTGDTFINNLEGNTQAERHWRKVSPEVNPAKFAVWTLERLSVRLDQYLESVYHENHHTTLGCSPQQQFLSGIHLYGERKHSHIAYTDDFIILTMPSTAKGTAKVTNRGVKIMYLYFSSPALADLSLRGKQIEVRYDPFNMGHAYAYVNGRWEECISEYYAIFKNYSQKAIMLASAYLRLKYRDAESQYEINAKRLAEFLQSIEADELLQRQNLNDSEAKNSRQFSTQPLKKKFEADQTPEFSSSDESPSTGNSYVPKILEDL